MSGQWGIAEVEQRRALVGAVVAALAAVGTLVAAAGGPAWAIVAIAGLGAAGAFLTLALYLKAWSAGRHDDRGLLHPPLRVREAAASRAFYDLGVDPEAPQALSMLGLRPGQHPAYIPRAIDRELRERLRIAAGEVTCALVVVSGPSKAGKSRSLFEAAAAVLPDAWLLAPRDATAVAALARGRPPRLIGRGPCVVWIDDIEEFSRKDDGLDNDAIAAFGEWGMPVLVLATQGGKGIELAGPKAAQFREPTANLLARHPAIRLDPTLDPQDLTRLDGRYPPQAVDAIATDGLGEFMIAAPRLLDKLEHGDCHEGKAIVRAAIDWQRIGAFRPLGTGELAELYVHYLPGPPTEERYLHGLEWAARPLYSNVALVRRLDAVDEYRAHDYVVDHAMRRSRPIPAAVWAHAIRGDATSEAELLRIGMVAHELGDVAHAQLAWSHADSRGNADAAANLARLLYQLDDVAGAEAAYRRADERGDARAANELGDLLHKRGDLEAAEAAWRRADGRGDAQGACRLGWAVERHGDVEAAKAAFRRAEERGHAHGAAQLGALLERQKSLEAAEAAYRRADKGGDAVGAARLGAMLEDRDDLRGAEAAFRRADRRGSSWGAYRAGRIAHMREDVEAAEIAYRRADERGYAHGSAWLGRILKRRNDMDGAEAAFRRADAAGDAAGAAFLGRLLHYRGDLEDAEAAFRRADERGSATGATGLGNLLRLRGDGPGAKAAFTRAADRGDPDGAFMLGDLLEADGELGKALSAFDHAERIALRRDAEGADDGAWILGRLLLRRDDVDGAEAAFRRADDRGSSHGPAWLGWLLANKRHRPAAALAAYRRGDQRGNGYSSYCVGAMLRDQGRPADALAAFSRADLRGDPDGTVALGKALMATAATRAEEEHALTVLVRGHERADRWGHETLVAEALEAIDSARERRRPAAST